MHEENRLALDVCVFECSGLHGKERINLRYSVTRTPRNGLCWNHIGPIRFIVVAQYVSAHSNVRLLFDMHV